MVLWTGTFLLLVIAFGVQQEWLERKYPSPDEWSWITRKDFRSARWGQDSEDNEKIVDWAGTGSTYQRLLQRLEDPNIDGAGIKDTVEGGILVAGIGKTGYDISMKSEPWRRGYYQMMMGAARAAEHLDGWVEDKSQNLAFPADMVVGPSNPNPKPVPPGDGNVSPPKEEDCEVAFETPESFYMKILTTQGFTEKQRMDAALAYAAWLDYKQTPEAAGSMYQWAMDIATSSSDTIVDRSGVLNPKIRNPSANILTATTALAVHHALNGRLSEALPIFISVLRARRSLPDSPTTMRSTLIPDEEKEGLWTTAMAVAKNAIMASTYPPPPDEGTNPPQRGPKERCEEAGIMTYIGEILYASKQSSTSREDGLAWTREAVDVAEEELRRKGIEKDAKKTCQQCLEVGLGNWTTMVKRMAMEEKEKKAASSGSWFGFDQKDGVGRWGSEEQVIKERLRRSAELLSPV